MRTRQVDNVVLHTQKGFEEGIGVLTVTVDVLVFLLLVLASVLRSGLRLYIM